MMKKLIAQVLKEYNEALNIDPENTDSLFFILDEIGSENDLDEQEFAQLSKLVEMKLA
jgi:hypothetical protein